MGSGATRVGGMRGGVAASCSAAWAEKDSQAEDKSISVICGSVYDLL